MPVHLIRHTALRVARFLALIPLFSVLTACATGQPAKTVPRTFISWPMGSEDGRIVWVKSITSPADIGIGTGVWQRMLEVVTGEDSSGIVRPHSVLRTAAGVLYLADPGRGVVHSLDIAKGTYTVIGGREGAPLRSPIGLAEDNLGRLYITDSMTAMVYRFTPGDGSLKPLLSQPLERPTGIAFNPVNKLLYVADTMASQIIVLDQNGFIKRRIGRHGDGETGLNRPTDLAIDARGQIYVTDSLNFRITIMTPEGQTVNHFGSPGDTGGTFSRPKGIAVDSTGNIYVNDSLMDTVQVFDHDGLPQLVFGRNGSEPGQFWLPSGLFIDRLDQIYVADTYNRRIQVFRYLAHSDDENEGHDTDLFDKPLTPSR
jgi:DNA-binding beta-propeller fold protein YncE